MQRKVIQIEFQYLISGFWTCARYRRWHPLVININWSKSFRHNIFILGFWKATIFCGNSLWLYDDISIIKGCHGLCFMLSSQNDQIKLRVRIQITETMIAWIELKNLHSPCAHILRISPLVSLFSSIQERHIRVAGVRSKWHFQEKGGAKQNEWNMSTWLRSIKESRHKTRI